MKKRAVLCGASQGLGKVLAYKLQNQGWEVAIFDLKKNDEMQQAGMKFYQCDMSNFLEATAAFDGLFSEFKTCDALVNCIRYRRAPSNVLNPIEEWKKVMEVGLYTYFHACLIVAEQLKSKMHPCSIVNLSSITSILVTEKETMSYHAAKAAINQMTRYLAVKYGPHLIRVNAVLPGLISKETAEYASNDPRASAYARLANVIPLRRSGSPEEVAELVLFLVSPAAAFITGQSIIIDGGLSIREQLDLLGIWAPETKA